MRGTYPEEPPAALIRQWQAGETAAGTALVEAWQEPLGRLLGRLVGEPTLAADLRQETFLRMFQARAAYQDQGQFRPWLFRIAVNLVRDSARRWRPQTGDYPELFDARPGPAEQAAEADEAARVREALFALPEPLREVVILRHYEEWSFELMARTLGTPASTLKSRFQLAIRTLQETLAPKEVSAS
ncbi:MAG: RNA polymerase sigma factor [Gemmataceae bacterium]